ncbi:MAG: precorrin-6y C5,15-methyltransferase (decarboxylating) subunit CbiE [Anaerovoracaceae bacterium]
MKVVNIIGIGMGNPQTITLWGQSAISESTFLIGAKRMVDAFKKDGVDVFYGINPEEIIAEINKRDENENIAVLMSGDVGFYSGAKKLKSMMFELCDNAYVTLVPGLSSLQYFAAAIGISWDDAKVVSLHGRNGNPLGEVLSNKKTFFLLGKDNTPAKVCSMLTEFGLGDLEVFVGAQLSYEEEFIFTNKASIVANMEFDPLSVMMVINEEAGTNGARVHGISDDEFIRGSVPMTKEEVRSVSISKLGICPNDVVYDVGAGTGSVSIEMALQAQKGFVFAIETNKDAVSLLHQNKENFKVQNLKVIEGLAPNAMVDLPVPDKAFIGGSKGNLESILELLLQKNEDIRVVINAIALETVGEAIKALDKFNMACDIVQIGTARTKVAGKYHMMNGLNPVFVITGQRIKEV